MAGGRAGVGGRERAGARRGLPGEEMPLVPHPPSTRTGSGGRSASGEEGGAPQIGRAPSGGRQRDVGALAGAKKQDLPTLNMEKIGLESRGEVSQALGSHRMGTANAAQVLRGRQYTGGQARQPGAQPQGPQAERAPQQPSTGQPRPAPAPRRVVPTAGGEIKHLVPHPPSAGVRSGGGGQPAHSLGNGGAVGAQPDLPDRNKVEPTHPLTARPVPTQQGEGKARQAAGAVPQTARPTIDSDKVQPQAQKYDEVSKPSATGGSNVPLTPAAALKLYMTQMTLYEQGEILDFPQVFYVGPNAAKHRPSADAADNHGFDDDRGDYIWVSHDHIAYRYEILGILGKGSFGVVAKVFDWKTNQLMALKIIRNKKRFHHQALVEVKLLEHLRDHDADGTASIVYMRDYFYFRNHMCITFELLCINLYEFIKNNKFQGLSLGLIRRIAVQLLLSLRFLRKLRVIHCDLKPENILLKAPNKSSIKVIDFGSSCFENERVYTYIQSRFYRSPEVILGLPYDMAIDMWSFGCILAELYTGYPIFPGENEVEQLTCILALCEAHARTHARARTHTHTHTHTHTMEQVEQLACIMELQGIPPRHLIEQASRRKMFFDSNGAPKIVANSRGKKRRPSTKDLASVLRCNDAAFVSFLDGCLQWDKNQRFSPDQALQHEWITEVLFFLFVCVRSLTRAGCGCVVQGLGLGRWGALALGRAGTDTTHTSPHAHITTHV